MSHDEAEAVIRNAEIAEECEGGGRAIADRESLNESPGEWMPDHADAPMNRRFLETHDELVERQWSLLHRPEDKK